MTNSTAVVQTTTHSGDYTPLYLCILCAIIVSAALAVVYRVCARRRKLQYASGKAAAVSYVVSAANDEEKQREALNSPTLTPLTPNSDVRFDRVSHLGPFQTLCDVFSMRRSHSAWKKLASTLLNLDVDAVEALEARALTAQVEPVRLLLLRWMKQPITADHDSDTTGDDPAGDDPLADHEPPAAAASIAELTQALLAAGTDPALVAGLYAHIAVVEDDDNRTEQQRQQQPPNRSYRLLQSSPPPSTNAVRLNSTVATAESTIASTISHNTPVDNNDKTLFIV